MQSDGVEKPDWRRLPLLGLAGGLAAYLVDSRVGGFVPHVNALVHESGHWILGTLSGVAVKRVSIGLDGNLMVPAVKIGGADFLVYWQAFKSSVNMSGETLAAAAGGPVFSILWGVLLMLVAKRIAADRRRWMIALTIVVALTAVDSFMARGLFNLLSTHPQSDGARILALTRLH